MERIICRWLTQKKNRMKSFKKVKGNYLTGIKYYANISKMPRSEVISLSEDSTGIGE